MKNVCIFLLLVSCSGIKRIESKKTDSAAKVVAKKIEVFVQKPVEVRTQNGKVRFVGFNIRLKNGQYKLNCVDRDIPFYVVDRQASMYLSENYFSKASQYICLYKGKTVLHVTRSEFPYKSEKLNVDKRRVFISKRDLVRVERERVIKKEIYKKSSPVFLFDKPFIRPLNSYITSHYGNRRLFNNKKQSQHLGNDLRARTPTRIPASNRGRVVYAGELFYSGNVVIIDHGLGLFTAYGHLSKIYSQLGDIVNQGDTVGLSGATGRVSGPHLHWGVKNHNDWIDGFSLVKESKKQFK